MKKYLIFLVLVLGIVSVNYEAYAEGTEVITNSETQDSKTAAENFVAHVNYARVAIAMKDDALAKEHILSAKELLQFLKSTTIEQRRIPRVEAGQVVYDYQTTYKYHYYPIQTGIVTVKKVVTGPFWAKNPGVAVTDANVVYLTLDLTGDVAEKNLALAEEAIKQKKFLEADNNLSTITNSVVQVDQKEAVPLDVASDNILLARRFISVQNYEAARFSLRHADTALDNLAKIEEYKVHGSEIKTMHQEINELYKLIAKNNPTLLISVDAKLEKLWNSLRSWAK